MRPFDAKVSGRMRVTAIRAHTSCSLAAPCGEKEQEKAPAFSEQLFSSLQRVFRQMVRPRTERTEDFRGDQPSRSKVDQRAVAGTTAK